MRLRSTGVLVILPWLSWSASALAGDAENAPAAVSSEAATATAAPDVVVVALRGDELPREPLRAAMSRELTAPVVFESEPRTESVRGVVTIHYAREKGELAVTWDGVGRTVSRVIAAAPEPSDVVVDSVLLAGNLARDQAGDLVPAKAEREAVPPPPVVPPPPAVPPPPSKPHARAAREPARLLATASVFYPLATHYDRPDATSRFDVNLLYGRVGAVDGAQLGVVNVVTRGGETPPVMSGLQLGLLVNVVNGDVMGLQAAPVLNFARGGVEGVELSFGANMAAGDVTGLQGALAFNAARDLKGAQVSAVNVAGDVDGLQIGFVNVARNVRGVSIGLVNVADDIDGVPLAPISVTRTGGVHPVVWSGTSGFGNVGVKFATRKTYTIFFTSYHRAFDDQFVGGGLALGGRIRLGDAVNADIDASGTYLIAPGVDTDVETDRSYHEQLVQPRVRMLLGLRMAEHFGFFVGGAAVGTVRGRLDWDRVTATIGPELFGGVEL